MRNYDFTDIALKAVSKDEKRAALFFSKEIFLRTGKKVNEYCENKPLLIFTTGDFEFLRDKDCWKAEQNGNKIEIFAKGIRGLIFGYSYFLRKCEFKDGKITLIQNISGLYEPDKKIRGHQIGYRTTPNTYDAWNYKQYFRYCLDMASFGNNICEHIPYEGLCSRRNRLMKYDEEDFLVIASRLADAIDTDVSLWHPNCDGETADEAVERREKLYKRIPRIDVIFPPGGDPGELPADEFVSRCNKISDMVKRIHPEAKMFPSAQAPHSIENWGETFVESLKKDGSGIDGVIMGPNHAYPMHELRKIIPSDYPLRFYPDITHNVRCEYPVHFLEDDWHTSFASTLSREGVNPRPSELRTLHRIFSPYTIGSVSYSEGVHDDLNKMVWSILEFDKDADLREAVSDYVRFFMYSSDTEKLTDCIFALEKNWDCDPLESPCVKNTYKSFCELKKDYPSLSSNWRFMLLYFRACCDEFVFEKRKFETELINDAVISLSLFEIDEARKILGESLPKTTLELRDEIEALGKTLFDLIGIQLDVEHYCANGWERGATLDTIDNPVTDRLWLLNRLDYCDTLGENEKKDFISRLLNRNKTENDEVYYSVALHGLNTLGVRQNGEFYMNYQGDRPDVNNGSIPTSMLKVFDHFSFECKFGGFKPDTDYVLRIIYKSNRNDEIKHHKIVINDTVIYDGKRFGGRKDEIFDKELLAPGFESASYDLPRDVFINGTLEIKISEPTEGFEICELWIIKK